MPVGATESEGVDANDDGMFGKGLDFRLHLHRAAVKVNLGIRDQVVLRRRREGSPLHHQDDLQQRAMERGSFHVPDVALDAGHAKRHFAFKPAERLRDGIAFDPISHHGACRVSFDVVEFQGAATGTGECGAHQFRLCVSGRRGDVAARRQANGVVRRARCVDRARLDYGMNVVPIALCRRQGFQRENEGAFGTHIAIGLGVE